MQTHATHYFLKSSGQAALEWSNLCVGYLFDLDSQGGFRNITTTQ